MNMIVSHSRGVEKYMQPTITGRAAAIIRNRDEDGNDVRLGSSRCPCP